MIQFVPITLSDRTLFEPYLKNAEKEGAEYSFTTLYMWAGIFHSFYKTIQINGQSLLIVKSQRTAQAPLHFLYPMGMEGPVSPQTACAVLKEASGGIPFVIGSLSAIEAKQLGDQKECLVDIKEDRDSFDYVYEASALATLKGKRLQSKRNHLNAFIKDYPNYEVLPITPEAIPDCLVMNDRWCQLMGCRFDLELGQEACAVHRAFRGFRELGLEGMMVLADNQIIAYTLGEIHNGNTLLVHVEKAFPQYRGAYQLINREFARHILNKYPDVKHINREDDAGDEGLRKAKLSYRPAFFIEKQKAFIPALPKP